MDLKHVIRLDPRQVWKNEATSFTPWLAEAENFSVLADTLHLFEAEVEATEYTIGAFSADILARDRDGFILVENQLEQTDHTHLGQVLTYVAGLEQAAKVIWISTKFREEHRATIDWLNEQTNDDFSFFAVELEAIQIGESPAAPLFHVVAKPNYWTRHVSKRSKQIGNSALTERQQKYLEFWTAFAEFLDTSQPGLRGSNPPKDHWWPFPIGRAGFQITLTAGARDRWIGTELYCQNDPDKKIIEYLYNERTQIEEEYGAPLLWEKLDDRKGSRIAVRWENIDPFDQKCWSEIFPWYSSAMQNMRSALADRIRKLDLDHLQSTDGSS